MVPITSLNKIKPAFHFVSISIFLLFTFALFSNLKADPINPKSELEDNLWELNNEAWRLMSAGESYAKVDSILDSTLILARENGWELIEVDCYSQKSSLYQRQNKLDSALSYANKAFSIRKKLQLIDKVGDSHNNLGLIHKKLGDLDSALFHFRTGMTIWQKLGNDTVIALLQNNLADALYHKGELEKALTLATNSLEIRLALGEPNAIANTRMCLGNLYLELGAFDSARSQYNQILRYAQDAKSFPLEVKAQSCLVGLLIKEEKVDEALILGQRVFTKINENAGKYQIEYDDITKLIYQLGVISQKRKENKNAEAYFKRVISLSKGGNLRDQVFAEISLGELYLQTERFDSAAVYLEKGLEKVRDGEQNVLHKRLLDDLAYLNAQLGDYEEAFRYVQAEDSLGEMLNSNLRGAEVFHFNSNLKLYEQTATAKRQSLISDFLTAFFILAFIGGVFFYRQRIKVGKQKAEVETKKLQIEKLVESNKTDSILSMLKGEETERSRIYVELHNQVGALFTLVKYPFEQGYEVLNQETWDKLEKDLTQIQSKVRAISHKNGQTLLAQRYFGDAIQELCEKTTQNSNIKVEHTFDFDEEKLGLDTRAKLHAVISELLNNSVKHSHASQIEVNLTEVDEFLSLMVIDNGKGFDIANKEIEGQGVKIIHAIATSLGGWCKYDSSPNSGTTVNIEIPLIEKDD